MVTAISLKLWDKEFFTFFEVLCAGALGNVKGFSLPAVAFCATGRVRVICSVCTGKDKDRGMTWGGTTLKCSTKNHS